MFRCGIPRSDGTVRIGILCANCATRALAILLAQQKKFYKHPLLGDVPCEACFEHAQLESGEG